MVLHAIDYNGGQIWVDRESHIKQGELYYDSGSENIIETANKDMERAYYQAKVLAQSPNLSLPNIPYVEIEEEAKRIDLETVCKKVTEVVKNRSQYLSDESYKAALERASNSSKAESAKKVIQSIDVDIVDGKIVVKSIYYKKTI